MFQSFIKSKKLHPYQIKALLKMEDYFGLKNEKKGYLQVATGGGKSLIACTYILKNFILKGKRVLWVAPDWFLLVQAFLTLKNDFASKYNEIISGCCCYLGNNKDEFLVEGVQEFQSVPDVSKISLIFSSLHTLARRNLEELYNLKKIDLIVMDEAHWGIGGYLERDLLEVAESKQILILGLTATPKRRVGWKYIYNKTFRDLIPTYLAKPIFYSVPTGIKVDSSAADADQMFNRIQESVYKKLEMDNDRNRLILKTYDQKKHGRTIVFACSKEHAADLFVLFKKHDVPSLIAHSGLKNGKEEIRKFKIDKNYKVLITVNMANQGIDIPDVQSLFITRPVTSDIMYSQMIGRGSRKDKDTKKTFFNVIDFEDNFVDSELRRLVLEAKIEYFGSALTAKSIYKDQAIKISSSAKIPLKLNLQYPSELISYDSSTWSKFLTTFESSQSILELPVLEKQTFGVELELTTDVDMTEDRDAWTSIAQRIHKVMSSILPEKLLGQVGEWKNPSVEDYQRFNLVYDGSCGWEIVTPVLKGLDGFSVLADFLEKFKRKLCLEIPELKINHKTGLHVHFGFSLDDLNLPTFLDNLARANVYMGSMVAPSRFFGFDPETGSYDRYESNDYCKPIAEILDKDVISRIHSKRDLKEVLFNDFDGEVDRYLDINFKNILEADGINTIEVRLHSGTIDSLKILSWISLWMGILQEAKEGPFDRKVNPTHITKPCLDTFSDTEISLGRIFKKSKMNVFFEKLIDSYVKERVIEVKAKWEKERLLET